MLQSISLPHIDEYICVTGASILRQEITTKVATIKRFKVTFYIKINVQYMTHAHTKHTYTQTAMCLG